MCCITHTHTHTHTSSGIVLAGEGSMRGQSGTHTHPPSPHARNSHVHTHTLSLKRCTGYYAAHDPLQKQPHPLVHGAAAPHVARELQPPSLKRRTIQVADLHRHLEAAHVQRAILNRCVVPIHPRAAQMLQFYICTCLTKKTGCRGML